MEYHCRSEFQCILFFSFPPAIKSNLNSQFLITNTSYLKHAIQKSDSFTDLNDMLCLGFFLFWFVIFFSPSLKENADGSFIAYRRTCVFLQKIASLAYLDISMGKCINKDQPKMKGIKHICTIYSLIAR